VGQTPAANPHHSLINVRPLYEQELRVNINTLAAMGNDILPVVLKEGNQDLDNGKCPTLIEPDGTVSRIKGREGWSAETLEQQIERANANGLALGIAVKPPADMVILDLDVQNYPGGQVELMSEYEEMVKSAPQLRNTRTEVTRSGGLHIYAKVNDLTGWQKSDGKLRKNLCSRHCNGMKRGELLSSTSICVAAPSFERYRVLEGTPADRVITLKSLDQIGVHPCVQPTLPPASTTPQRPVVSSPNGFSLRELLGPKATTVLSGKSAYSDSNSGKNDRSLQLVGFAKEAYGCENLATEYGIALSETADELVDIVTGKFNLEDKADRVLDSIKDDRFTYKASRPEIVRQQLGVTDRQSNRKPVITADIAEREITKALGEIRERVRTGEIILANGLILERDEIDGFYIDLCKLTAYQWGRQLAKDAIFKLARKNRYDHIKEHFRDMVASATPLPDHQWYSLDQLLFGIDDPIARMYLPKYLIGAVTRLMKPGCPYVATPILIGGQGIGKSASANVLFGPEFVVDDLSHDLSKDDLSRLHTSFCTELSEVDGITNKADRERLKAFMTRTVDIYRPPYGISNVKRERAFVFWGTSNSVPLNDPSGNRRFVAIDLRSKSKANPIPLNQIEQHRAAIWARAFKEYYAKTPYELNATEQSQVNANNGLFTVADSWGEKLSRKLSLHPSHTCLTVEEGFTILGILPGQQTQANQKRLREVLESLGYQSAKVTLPDGRRVNRLTRQIGQKQVPISVSHCLMGD
jgi:predicted P-loop ATPase